MTTPTIEPWLRGPIPGLAPALQPVAHALIGSLEDVARALEEIPPQQVWQRPNGAASLGFHLTHLSGATDRLFTYARGEPLSEAQRSDLTAERQPPDPLPTVEALLVRWRSVVDAALRQLAATPEPTLAQPRAVGRAALPSTVLGLLAHAAEHAQRHTGQLITTAKFLRGARQQDG